MDGELSIILMLAIVVPIMLLSFFVFFRLFYKGLKEQKPKERLEIETGIIFDALGGKENILLVEREMSRVTFTLQDIELVQKDGLSNLGATGVLLVGNKVKCNFKENAENIERVFK